MTSILSTAITGLTAATDKAAKAASNIAGINPDDQSVTVKEPDVQDIVDIKIAAEAYKANIAVVKVDNDMSRELLGIFDKTV